MTATARSLDLRLDERHFSGEVVSRSGSGYEQHRQVWNGSIDRRPAAILRCTRRTDVMEAVTAARRGGWPVTVRSGGHSFAGLSVADDAVMIDLSPMKGVRVDPEKQIARVNSGVLLGQLDAETQSHHLAVPSGIVSHTGVAGLTLGGGLGWLMRKHGLTIDNLLSVDLVTADGGRLRADVDENPDLFWGVRGGGGNFGIVTEFEFRCVPRGPQVLAGPVVWAVEHLPEMLRFYRDWVAEAPDGLMTVVVVRRLPSVPSIPVSLHGTPVVMVVCCWADDPDEGCRFLRPLRAFASPLLDLCYMKPFAAHQAMFDASYPHGRWYYTKSSDLADLDDNVVAAIVDHATRSGSPFSSTAIWQGGGAVARVGHDDTAFHGRSAGFTVNLIASTESAEGFEAERAWVREYWAALSPWHHGVYVNFLGDEGLEGIRRAYGSTTFARLQALKRAFDPDNVFRGNQNIPPE